MNAWGTILGIIGLLILLGLSIYWVLVARRLDRLHRLVIATRTTTSDTLAHRAHMAQNVARSDILDVAGSVLLNEAATTASELAYAPLVDDGLEGTPRQLSTTLDRGSVESNLSRTLREVLKDVEDDALSADQESALANLYAASEAARIARRMHNSRVDQVRRVRQKRIVRWLRMAGTAPLPRPVDLDDQ